MVSACVRSCRQPRTSARSGRPASAHSSRTIRRRPFGATPRAVADADRSSGKSPAGGASTGTTRVLLSSGRPYVDRHGRGTPQLHRPGGPAIPSWRHHARQAGCLAHTGAKTAVFNGLCPGMTSSTIVRANLAVQPVRRHTSAGQGASGLTDPEQGRKKAAEDAHFLAGVLVQPLHAFVRNEPQQLLARHRRFRVRYARARSGCASLQPSAACREQGAVVSGSSARSCGPVRAVDRRADIGVSRIGSGQDQTRIAEIDLELEKGRAAAEILRERCGCPRHNGQCRCSPRHSQ